MDEIKALANYLDIVEDIEDIEEIETGLFEIIGKDCYYVFTPLDLAEYIKDEVIPFELDEAYSQLKRLTKYCKYTNFFEVDSYGIDEYCYYNLEEVLQTEPRVSYIFEDKEYIIFKLE